NSTAGYAIPRLKISYAVSRRQNSTCRAVPKTGERIETSTYFLVSSESSIAFCKINDLLDEVRTSYSFSKQRFLCGFKRITFSASADSRKSGPNENSTWTQFGAWDIEGSDLT